MIKAEQMIKKYGGPQFPWSPKLAIAILEFSIWKLVQSDLKTNASCDTKLQQLTTRLNKLDSTSITKIPTHERTNMKIINKNIKIRQELKEDTKNSRTIREGYLNEKI